MAKIKVILKPSARKDKKLVAVMPQFKHKHSFGARGMSDFTKHKDPKRKENYIKRHAKREDWDNIHSAGFWAKHILWNKPSLREAVKDVEKKYNLDITVKNLK